MTSIKVCKYFIKSSPVGELHEVLDDISKVFDGNTDYLHTPEIKESLREYFETHRLHVHLPNGTTGLVAAMGRQEPLVKYSTTSTKPQPPKKSALFDGEDDEYGAEKQEQQEEPAAEESPQVESVEEFVYYDPVRKIKFSFNPITLEARIEEENVDWETQYLQPNVTQLRDQIVEAMHGYLSLLYKKGTAEFAVYAQGDGSQLQVEISCHNLNFKSYWGGEWVSTWTIDLNAGGTVAGHIRVHNHYYEQGNIQFNLNKDIPAAKVKELTGKCVVDYIKNQESKYQDGLEDMYTEVSDKLLKGMRRMMPITRQKFDWSRPQLL